MYKNEGCLKEISHDQHVYKSRHPRCKYHDPTLTTRLLSCSEGNHFTFEEKVKRKKEGKPVLKSYSDIGPQKKGENILFPFLYPIMKIQ